MTKRITKLMAALALLVSLAIPMGMKAAEGDVHDMNITQSTLLNNNAAIPSINIAAQSYSVNKVTINWRYNKAIENPVTIEVLVGENSWGTQTITGNITADAVFEGESTIGAIVINFTNNTGSGTGHGTFYVNSVKLTEGESSGPAPTTYTVTFDAGDGTFVGNTDFPNASNTVVAGTYSLPSATPATGYTFNGWAMGETTYQAGASYTVSGDADFVASYTENTTPTPGGADVLNWAATGSPTNYTDWTYTAPSGAVYKGQSSGTYQSIQLRSNNNNSGIVTTTSAGKVTNISVTWNSNTTSGRTLNVYGKNSAYSAATDLYGNNAGTLIGTIVCGTSTELVITDDYEYIGMRSASGAMYLDEIQITWESVTPALVATPTFNPASGTEFGDEGLSVEISCATENTTIYYTLDGSEPDDESTEYTEAISLTETTTIKAIAFDSDDNTSAVATATYTYVDPNQPGTQANPYTVAQARAAIDAGTGTQGVYATGIVSSIPTAWNSQYSNITFNFVDNAGDTEFLQAYRCKSSSTANASEVQVGDVVVVYGNLKNYNGTYEFDANCQLVSLTHPAVAVEAPTFSPVAGTYAEVQTVAISSETEGTDIYYTLDGTDPTMESSMYENPITVSETTTIKAIAVNGDDVASNVASANYYFCSADDPYTVTEALAFQAYQYPANGIYVHGIVSTAPTQAPTNNGELTYYISVDGEATNQLEVYKGKGLEQAAFTAQDDLQVGDIVTVYGNVQVYNSTIEFATGNYLVEFERPTIVVPSVTVTPNIINAPAEGAEGNLALAYENITEFYSFDFYFCDAEGEELQEDPDWIDAEINPGADDTYILDYLIDANNGEARTAYMKVYTYDDDEEEVYAIVTVNQEAYVAPVLDYAELPFEFDGGRADIETTDGLTQDGLDSDYSSSPKLKFKTTGTWVILHFNERPGTLTFDIKGNGFSGGTFTVQTSEDGVTYTDLETYTELGDTQHESFANLGENVRYIKWIYTNKVSGNVGLGNIALPEYVAPALVASITVNPDEVELDAEEHDGTLDLTYENLTITDMDDFDIQYYDAEGEEADEPDWVEVLVAEQDPEIGEGYVVSYWMMENEGAEARTVYFKVYALDNEAELVYSNLVTVTQAAPETPATPGTWVLTSLADLTEDDIFVIVGDNGDTYAMSNDQGTQHAPATVAVTVTEGTLSGEPDANIQWNLEITDGGYIFYPNGTTESWLYCFNDNNGVRVGTGDAKHFTLDNSGYLTTTETNDQRYLGIYNSQDWRCYKNTTGNIAGQTFAFYKKVDGPAGETFDLEITGWANETNPVDYYLIATPVEVNPAAVPGMVEGEYDLYSFLESGDENGNEWINYNQGVGNTPGFNKLEVGKGYLYAHPTDITLQFTGTPVAAETFDVELDRTPGAEFEGRNLVGNPFTVGAYIDREYYIMNSTGTNYVLKSSNDAIAPMTGIMVEAETDGETLTFSKTAPETPGQKVVMNVTSSRSNIVDRATIRFGEGRQLHKFMFNPNCTKLYIPQADEEFAVVRSSEEAEMPVNFKAAENGTYTISFSTEEVEMDYMHLIDNVTGDDIDLLATPSYTFVANTTDYANRFNLVFATTDGVNENSESHFAFYNGSNWVISNKGNATLQVVDMLGRVLSSESINGNATMSAANLSAGVYVMRLVNGNVVKTQKVVVK